ncbi:FAD-dependent oxidoreductase [Streptomyces zaehneri]|uniref:FAD-dependent oxidoreductase n=1 Tax=Streptomyces zaehneri TaxID=3051180 RepID=UPI0028D47D57|nr:FAD-dependent oxidoreductase [Streptomyces sp. DSM 40713]
MARVLVVGGGIAGAAAALALDKAGQEVAVYEALRRPRVEHDTTVGGNISRGVRPPPPRTPGSPPPARPDAETTRRLEWAAALR